MPKKLETLFRFNFNVSNHYVLYVKSMRWFSHNRTSNRISLKFFFKFEKMSQIIYQNIACHLQHIHDYRRKRKFQVSWNNLHLRDNRGCPDTHYCLQTIILVRLSFACFSCILFSFRLLLAIHKIKIYFTRIHVLVNKILR